MPGNSAVDPSRSEMSPIPKRASALRPGEIAVRSRYPRRGIPPLPESNDDVTRIPTHPSPPSQPGQSQREPQAPALEDSRDDITRIPTQPRRPRTQPQSTSSAPLPVVWQYESSIYEAESSLSSLSLIKTSSHVTNQPISPPSVPQQAQVQILQTPSHASGLNFADITTTPPPLSLPPAPLAPQAIHPARAQPPTNTPPVSSYIHDSPLWASLRAEFAVHARNTLPRQFRRTLIFSLWDRLRWWLLIPGRIEFLLWLGGALLLLSITVLFLFVGMLSLFAAHLIR